MTKTFTQEGTPRWIKAFAGKAGLSGAVTGICLLMACSAAHAQTPGGVSSTNLKIWLKANDGVVTADGANMPSWNDQSGATNHFVAHADPTTLTVPTHHNKIINFNPAVLFADQATFFADTASIGIKNSTMYVVGIPSTGERYLWGSQQSPYKGDLPFYIRDSAAISYWDDPAGIRNTSLSWRPREISLFRAVYTNAVAYDATYTKCGDSSATLINPNINPDTAVNFYNTLGGWTDSTFIQPFGYVAETIVFDKDNQTATEKIRVQTYLAIKYGITLGPAAQNYVLSTSGNAWNATTNAGYNNRIFGIARDNGSGLHQRVSQSSTLPGLALANGTTFSEIMASNTALATDNTADMVGDNGASLAFSVNLTTKFRCARIWKVQELGTVGTVTVRAPRAWFLVGVPSLLVSGDATINLSDAQISASSSDATYYYFNVNFTTGQFFSFARDVITSQPGGVSTNLLAWYDASMLNLPDGTDMSGLIWGDACSYIGSMVGVDTPIYQTNVMNYNPAVACIGRRSRFQVSNPFIFVNGSVAYGAGIPVYGLNNGYGDYWVANNSDRNVMLYNIDGVLGSYDVTNGYLSSDVSWPYNVPSFVSGSYTTTTCNLRRSGTIAATTLAYDLPSSALYATLGNWPDDPYTENFGYIPETAIYGNTISATDKQKIETYFALKYSVPQAQDYKLSNNTTAWSIAPAAYNNRIIGIAKDAALLQKQSHTTDDSLRLYVSTLATNNLTNAGTITNASSSIIVGQDNGAYNGTVAMPMPGGIQGRFARQFKVTNTNFADNYSLEFIWQGPGIMPFNIADIRLLVDNDGNFSDATVVASGSMGITIAQGSIIVSGINPLIVPLNSTRYLTIGTVNIATTPLTVSLVDFTATRNENKVDLEWKTNQEKNSKYFTVQRSADASTWTDLLRVNAAGNSTDSRYYKATDNSPLNGISFYRLRQTDADGRENYSGVRSVHYGTGNSPITIVPNPAKNLVSVTADEAELSSLHIYDAAGRDVGSKVRVITVSAKKKVLDVSELAAGVYFIKTGNASGSLIKQ